MWIIGEQVMVQPNSSNDFDGLMSRIDELLGEEVTSTVVQSDVLPGERHPLALAIKEAIGLDALVVTGDPLDTSEQQAIKAAMAARDVFLPRHIGRIAQSVLNGETRDESRIS